MKVLYLESNENKNSGKELNKIEARFAEGKQKINSLKIKPKNVRMSKGNLIIQSKQSWNIKKWIFGKLMSFIF